MLFRSNGHINEQWPGYWAALFAAQGFTVLDPFRATIWHDERVEWWYRQNLLLVVRRDKLRDAPFNSMPRLGELTLVREPMARRMSTRARLVIGPENFLRGVARRLLRPLRERLRQQR